MSKLKFWFPFLGYSVIIFVISSLPSSRVTLTQVVWDKLLHTIEYAPLGFWAAYGLRQTSRLPEGVLWLAAVALATAYGISDEFHQSFVPGRESSLYDALADFLGSCFGAGLYLISVKYLRKRKSNVCN